MSVPDEEGSGEMTTSTNGRTNPVLRWLERVVGIDRLAGDPRQDGPSRRPTGRSAAPLLEPMSVRPRPRPDRDDA